MYSYGERLCAQREGKMIFSADKKHENVGADVYHSWREERKKEKREYDAEHSCSATHVTEYLEKPDASAKQRCAIKFCVRLKKTPSETTTLLKKAFGKETIGDSKIRWWHKAFAYGQESVEFEARDGAPQTVVTATNINTITTVIEEDQHLSVQARSR